MSCTYKYRGKIYTDLNKLKLDIGAEETRTNSPEISKYFEPAYDLLENSGEVVLNKYANHYIAWFRDTSIVRRAIKKWGSEEALVKAIGEQSIKQKGEAWQWWKDFLNYMKNLFNNMPSREKVYIKNALTDAFLSRQDLEKGNTMSSERVKELMGRQSGNTETTSEIYSKLGNKTASEHVIIDNVNGEEITQLQDNLSYEQVEKLFEENPEIANSVYEELGFKDTPDVILPIGTSGSGKSTFIKSLPQKNLVVIEPDAMRVEFTGNMNDKYRDKEIYIEAANRAIAALQGKETPNQIYNKLGSKTKEENVVIKSIYQTAGIQYAKSIGGVFSLRVNGTNNQFGNPFSNVESEIQKGLIRTKSTKESVEKYIEWILSPATTIKPEQHKFIREWLQSGKLKGKPIVYYKELGEPSHATALDYLINKYDWDEKPKQVVFDTTNLTKEKRRPFIEAIKKEIPDANIQYKLLPLNPELAKQRIKAQIARGENRANVSDATIDRHAESYKQMLEDIKSEPISNFEITPQQKQQAQQLYSSYLQTTNNPTIEGFKQWNNRQQQINKLFESNPELANQIYETLGFKQNITKNLVKSKHDTDEYRFSIGDFIKEKNSVRVTKNKEGDFSIHEGDLSELTKQQKIALFQEQSNAIPIGGQIVQRGASSFDGIRHRINLKNHGFSIKYQTDNLQEYKSTNKKEVQEFADLYNLGKVIEKDGKLFTKGVILTKEQNTNFVTTQQKQQATFMFSEFLDVYLQDFNQVEKILKEENTIEKDCTSGGKLKAEKGLQTNFTKGGKWKIYEIFEGKSHKQGGIDISIKNNQISFTNKNGSIKAKYGLVISNSLVDTLPVMEDYAQDSNIIPQSQYKPTRAKDKNIHYYAVQDKVSFYDKEKDLDSFWNKYKNRQDLYGYLTDYGKDSKGEYISLYKKSGNRLTNLFTTPVEYYDRIYKSDLENLKTKRINDTFDKYYKEKDYISLKKKISPDYNIKELEQPSYEEQRQWLEDYIKSPLYKETLLNEYEKSGKNIKTIDSDIQNRYRRVKNVPIEEVKIHPKGYGYIRGITYNSENNPNEINNKTGQPDNIYNQSNPKGWSDYKTGHIQIDPNAKFLDPYVVGHELTHKSTEGNKYLTKFTRNKLLNSVNKDNLGSGYTDKQLNRSYNYLDNPTEVHARLTELKYMMHRYGIYNPMKEKMTKEHLIKALQNPYIRKSLDIEVLLDMLNNKGDVIDLMNTIAENKHNSNSDIVIG